MRSFIAHKYPGLAQLPANEELDNKSLDTWVKMAGASAAGWLAGQHRKELHASGAVDFKIPNGKVLPPWFHIAIETFRRRSGWAIITRHNAKQRVFRLRWFGWGRQKPV